MKKPSLLIRIIGVMLLILVLILIRYFQKELFYDPFLEYFANDFSGKTYPSYDSFRLYSNVIFRYALNSTISVLIIALLFWKKYITVASIQVYAIVGLVFLILYIGMIESHMSMGEKITFYIRRVLIQPFLLLILIPIFFVSEHEKKT